jgi:membrane-anchored mycosin MYCP
MQRIEATAHHPSGGWDPLVGAGIVDFIAAVSTDPPVSPSPSPPRTPVPIAPQPLPARADHGGRDTALLGAAICGGVLTVVLITGALTARLRRDRGVRPTQFRPGRKFR